MHAYARTGYLLNYSEISTLSDEDKQKYLNTLRQSEINRIVVEGGDSGYEMIVKHFPGKFTEDTQKLISLFRAESTNEDVYGAMLPEGYGAGNLGDMVNFTFPTQPGNNRNYYSSGANTFDRFDLEDDVKSVFNGDYQVWENDDYYDGYNEGLETDMNGFIEDALKHDDNNLSKLMKSVGMKGDVDSAIKLLREQDKYDELETDLRNDRNQAEYDAKVSAAGDIQNKIDAIIYTSDEDEVQINTKSLSMYVASNNLFSTDETEYMDSFSELLSGILSDNDLPNNSEDYRETVDKDMHQNYDFDEGVITERFYEKIEKALEEFYDENDESYHDDEDDDTSRSRLEQLKYTVIQSLDNTLEALGEDPQANMIENDIVRIDINRSAFKLNGSVYVIITNKNTGNNNEGYIPIEQIAVYFTNYSLFETFKRFKNLL